MTAIVLTTGIVRGTRELTSRQSGEVFGTEVSIMTEVGTSLGETLKVVLFDRRDNKPPRVLSGQKVTWVVEVDAGRYGLGGTFVREASQADVASMPIGVSTFDVDAEPVPV